MWGIELSASTALVVVWTAMYLTGYSGYLTGYSGYLTGFRELHSPHYRCHTGLKKSIAGALAILSRLAAY